MLSEPGAKVRTILLSANRLEENLSRCPIQAAKQEPEIIPVSDLKGAPEVQIDMAIGHQRNRGAHFRAAHTFVPDGPT